MQRYGGGRMTVRRRQAPTGSALISSNCSLPTAICCTAFCRRSPTAAPLPTAAASPTACVTRLKWRPRPERPGRAESRSACGSPAAIGSTVGSQRERPASTLLNSAQSVSITSGFLRRHYQETRTSSDGQRPPALIAELHRGQRNGNGIVRMTVTNSAPGFCLPMPAFDV
jgi:hypothetical protein